MVPVSSVLTEKVIISQTRDATDFIEADVRDCTQ
jgi:hypothetical protein